MDDREGAPRRAAPRFFSGQRFFYPPSAMVPRSLASPGCDYPMPLSDTFPGVRTRSRGFAVGRRRDEVARDALLLALADVLVEPPIHHSFAGAIERDAAVS